jgi:hypothetical protein
VTYGRSGSTLLQGILNTINGVLIRGENENVFYDFFKSYQKLLKVSLWQKNAILPNQAWFGMGLFNCSLFMDHLRELSRGILLADQYEGSEGLCLGFKEIRYIDVIDDLENYLDFLTDLFPNTALLFNTRNLEDVAKSGWWKNENEEEVLGKLRALEERFFEYASNHSNSFHIDYSDVVNKSTKLKCLFDFIGAPYHEDTVDIVLNVTHSYKPNNKKK